MHKAFISVEKGCFKVYCSCSAQSKGKFESEEAARTAHREHKEVAKAIDRSSSLAIR